MAHDHSHGDRNAYYLDQLFTIATCGALGGVAVMLWYSGKLILMLHPKFFPWVLLGGLALLVLVLIRAIALWRSVDEVAAVPDHHHEHDQCGHAHGHCDHEHEHGVQNVAQTTGVSAASLPTIAPVAHHHHDHAHDHGHDHSHDHDHDHDHGWAPWRYVVLLLPVVLYFLNLPNQGFSADAAGDPLSGMDLKAPTTVTSTGIVNVPFSELQKASLTLEDRDFYEGKTVTLTGKYRFITPKRFTLTRSKINCCAADAVPLDAAILVDPNGDGIIDPDQYREKWVDVRGRVHFFRKPGTNEYVTSLILYPTKEEPLSQLAKIIPMPANPWAN